MNNWRDIVASCGDHGRPNTDIWAVFIELSNLAMKSIYIVRELGESCYSSILRSQCSFCYGRVMRAFEFLEYNNEIFTVCCSVCVCFYGISFRTQILLFLEPLTVGYWDLIKFKRNFGLILMKLSPCVNVHIHFIFSTNSALTCFSLGQFLNTLVLLYLTHSKYYLTFGYLQLKIDWRVVKLSPAWDYPMQY